jgi:hypothetical protein
MSRKLAFVFLGLLTAFNVVALAINAVAPARAAVAGMSYQKLVHDKDFTRAVKSVVQACKVNVELGKLAC